VALDDSKRKIIAGILRPEDTGPELREMPSDPHRVQEGKDQQAQARSV